LSLQRSTISAEVRAEGLQFEDRALTTVDDTELDSMLDVDQSVGIDNQYQPDNHYDDEDDEK
jgi:hypothetical protein